MGSERGEEEEMIKEMIKGERGGMEGRRRGDKVEASVTV